VISTRPRLTTVPSVRRTVPLIVPVPAKITFWVAVAFPGTKSPAVGPLST